MVVPYFDQGSKDIIPGLLFHHDSIREHAPIPANMVEGFGQFTLVITQPESRMMCDIKLAIRISHLAVTPRLVM